MKKAIVFAVLAVALFACSSEGNNENSSSKSSAPTASVDGEKIFKTYCVTCHGIAGDMGANGAFNLQTSRLPLEERIHVITNGRNTMTPFKDLLNEQKIRAVAQYVEKLRH